MPATALFFAYILVAYALAALLCWPLGETAAAAGIPPHKIVSRGGLILALLGFWPFLKALRLADRHPLGYGLGPRLFWTRLTQGFGGGVVILVCLTLALLALQVRTITGEPDRGLLSTLGQGLLGGLAVGFIEETFFRGALFAAIRRRGGSVASALILPSLLYAALHFFTPREIPLTLTGDPGICVSSLAWAFVDLFQLQHLDSFVALTLVGLFLALVRHRTGHIAWCIGLHAGWVLVIRLTRSYTDEDPMAALGFLVGDYDGVIGWLAAGWIGALTLLLWLWPKRGHGPMEKGEDAGP
jgi:membrane protease YdiL (CAAX protease family)